MKLYWTIPAGLKEHYSSELLFYKNAFAQNDLQKAWYHLERAHILAQAYPKEHSYVHWKMLQFAFSIKSWTEIRGQILRLVFGGVLSFVGKVPIGNTGGANVPPMQIMDISPDLNEILKKYN